MTIGIGRRSPTSESGIPPMSHPTGKAYTIMLAVTFPQPAASHVEIGRTDPVRSGGTRTTRSGSHPHRDPESGTALLANSIGEVYPHINLPRAAFPCFRRRVENTGFPLRGKRRCSF
jgi:hypothetical protein